MSGSVVHPTTASSSILACAAMQPPSGSVERSADHSPQRIPEQSDPERIGEQSDSSAVQPAQHVSLPLPESSSTPRPHEYGVYGYNYEQATPVHPPDFNSASSASGESSVERRVYESQAPVFGDSMALQITSCSHGL